MSRLLLVLTGLLVVFGATAVAAPEIQVDADVYEFEAVTEGVAVSHTFVLTNVGDEALHIDRIRATCGCTTTALATDELAPGQSVDLSIRINTTGFSGRISKTIYVYSTDPRRSSDQADLTLRVSGTVNRAAVYQKTVNDMWYYYVVLVDIRSADAFQKSHLVGAINVPAATLEEELDAIPSDGLVVLYDEAGESSSSALVTLIGHHRDGRVLNGGLAAWMKAYGTLHVFPLPDDLLLPADSLSATINHSYVMDAAAVMRVYYILIDLRTPEEYASGHLVGAVNIPYSELDVNNLSAWLGDLSSSTELILYGQNSSSSDAAAQALRAAGYARAQSLLGGLDEWTRQYQDRLLVLPEAE